MKKVSNYTKPKSLFINQNNKIEIFIFMDVQWVQKEIPTRLLSRHFITYDKSRNTLLCNYHNLLSLF